jgi:hypothetical protein
VKGSAVYDDLNSSALTAKALQLDAELKAMADKAEHEHRDLTPNEKRECDKKLETLDLVASLADVRKAREEGRGPTLTFAEAVPTVAPQRVGPVARGSVHGDLKHSSRRRKIEFPSGV